MTSNVFKFATSAAVAFLIGLCGAHAQDEVDSNDQKQPKRIRVEAKDGKGAAEVQVDGKVIIVSPDGKVREIKIGEGEKRICVDGTDVKIGGRIVIIGPDGKKKEIEFGDKRKGDAEKPGEKKTIRRIVIQGINAQVQELEIGDDQPAVRRAIRIAGAAGKYMIGVSCEPVGEALRAHLKLGKEVGLVVSQLVDDSAAANAGVTKYDVIVAAGDKRISNIQELSSAVQNSGKAGKNLLLQIIRGGEKMNVAVKPEERKAVGFKLEGFNLDDVKINNEEIKKRIHDAIRRHGAKPEGLKKLDDLKIEVTPRIGLSELRILGSGDSDLRKKVEDLSRQVEKLQEAVKSLQQPKKD